MALGLLGVCAAAFVFAGAASEGSTGKTYFIEFDNAFGLVESGDFRIGDVTAGKTAKFTITKDNPPKALVEVTVDKPGYDDLRKDASCEIKPQSLIGEYYVTCQAGSSPTKLKDKGRIPVEQTASTIPQDLVNNIFRRPYRERFRLILSELGTGLAGRPKDLQEVLKRAHPGLRETSKVLRVLGNQNRIIERFIVDADTVIGDLESNKRDVARWVVEAGDAAEISATRREALRQSFRKLPSFLDELQPYMARLGELADEQVPLLSDLERAAPDLNTFLTRLGPFADASLPGLRGLGKVSVVGTRAFKKGADEVDELRLLSREAPALFKPLRQFLQTADDRKRAIDNDPRGRVGGVPASDPTYEGGRGGFTGLESVWLYPFWQTLSINNFDQYGHLLRIAITATECSTFFNEKPSAANAETYRVCNQYLGPRQPGLNAPDINDSSTLSSKTRAKNGQPAKRIGERRGPGQPEAGPVPGQPDISRPQQTLPPGLRDLLDRLPNIPNTGVPQVDGLLKGRRGRSQPNADQLLDFLLAP